jgi:hypothetical protein
MKLRLYSLSVVTVIIMSSSYGQSDSLVDMFPLALRNEWTYSYVAVADEYFMDMGISDVGTARYAVVGKSELADSILWTIQKSLDVVHSERFYFPGRGRDTSYRVQSSTSFVLIELLDGRHRLHRQQPTYNIWGCVFPFGSDFADSTLVYRYNRPDSANTKTLQAVTRDRAFRSTIMFKHDSGCVGVNTSNWLLTGSSYRTNHRLRNAIITEVNEPADRFPRNFALFQNYPNPFNPNTTIRFSVGTYGHTSLRIFDLLGREVATLVSEEMMPGSYERKFNAERLASGIYLYQLQSGGFLQTKKLLYLR